MDQGQGNPIDTTEEFSRVLHILKIACALGNNTLISYGLLTLCTKLFHNCYTLLSNHYI